MGRANAAVLPVPVWALPMTSRAGQDERDGAKLDGRGLGITHGLDAFKNLLGQAECGKTHGVSLSGNRRLGSNLI